MQALPQYFPVGVFGTGALLAKATATSSAMIERVGNILLGQLRWRGLSLDRAPGSMVAPARGTIQRVLVSYLYLAREVQLGTMRHAPSTGVYAYFLPRLNARRPAILATPPARPAPARARVTTDAWRTHSLALLMYQAV